MARSVNSIAFQADLLSKSGVFTSPIFSNLDRQRDGVHFDLEALVDASKINFAGLVNTAMSAAAAQSQPQPQTESAPAASPQTLPAPQAPVSGTPVQPTQ